MKEIETLCLTNIIQFDLHFNNQDFQNVYNFSYKHSYLITKYLFEINSYKNYLGIYKDPVFFKFCFGKYIKKILKRYLKETK